MWEASGHVGGFSDPMVDDRETRARYRADQLAVFALEFVASDGAVKRIDDVLFAAPGEVGKTDASELFEPHRKRIASLQKAHAGPNAARRRGAERAAGRGAAREGASARRVGARHADRAARVQLDVQDARRRARGQLERDVPAAGDGAGHLREFQNVCDTARVRVPFGIGQIGKAFRNEINPRNFTFRSREFEQMEIEFFCRPADAPKWYEYWRERRFEWYIGLGMRRENLHLREHDKSELAHYAAACADVEYDFPFGRSELEGIANRTDFDLRQHMQMSGKDLPYFDDQETDPNTRRFLPYVIEPSAGADRGTLAFLCDAYGEDQVGGEPRTVLKLHPRLAPIKAAVFPLVKKDGMPEKALEIYRKLKRRFNVFYDEKGAIGRRYRRQDEAGTPFCITVDGDTLSAGSVTVRERDSCEQVRVGVAELASFLGERLGL